MVRRIYIAVFPVLLACGDSGVDVPEPDGGSDAGGDLGPVSATIGERCPLTERVGLVSISEGRVNAFMFDRTDPLIGAPALTDPSCAFHEYRPAQPCSCSGDELCGIDGVCTAPPLRATDGRLVLEAAGERQLFTADPTLGDLGGEITLSGTAFTLEVTAFGQTVTLEQATEVPGEIASLTATLTGTYDSPEAIDASWDTFVSGHVFTHIPINHHAGGATFTECAVDTASGALRVERPMLEPLAVSTGLEFQSFDHTRFAAAETARGCVEIRFSSQQFISLF